jgi:ATP-dependent Clp protease ATP-binding subunit ClpA
MSANAIGFGRGHEAVTGKSLKAVEKAFSPEFRNRLDAVVAFSPLTPETMGRIVDKFVAELQAMLLTRKVTLALSPEAHAWFREHGFDEKFGARPLHRLLQTEVKDKLSDAVLFGALENGGHVTVTIVGGEVTLDCTPRG